MPRFAMLEHADAPDDPTGRHFDLLLEAGEACRTWRLMDRPRASGPSVVAIELPPHRLAWLDVLEGVVSGGRGTARRVDAGTYELLSADAPDLPSATMLVLRLNGPQTSGRLRLATVGEGWAVSLSE